MNKVIFLLMILFTTGLTCLHAEAPLSNSPSSQKGRILVRVVNLRNHEGDIGLFLFSDKKGFPGKIEHSVMNANIPASSESPSYLFENVPYGTYAVSVRHDENSNGRLDTNFLGMPKEGVGVSNNPKSRFGPPSFDDAMFVLDRPEVELEIRLR